MKKIRTILDLQSYGNPSLKEQNSSWLWEKGRRKKRVVVAGLGDVGRTLLIGLILLGRDVIQEIGIYDINPDLCRRLYLELNQIVKPFEGISFSPIYVADDKILFDCDLFIFCVAKAVPEVGSGISDVRMAQWEANRDIVSWYAKKAADEKYDGLFVVISDPVERLCKAALAGAGKGRHPLHPHQITGCGLGVMNARATYYARQNQRYEDYLISGRVFGAHGRELVVANDITEAGYNEERSKELTQMVLVANHEVRSVGYKPYIGPALSSGAMTILQLIKGEWSYCSNYLGGVYFGGRNRRTLQGIQWEERPLPGALFSRLLESYHQLEEE